MSFNPDLEQQEQIAASVQRPRLAMSRRELRCGTACRRRLRGRGRRADRAASTPRLEAAAGVAVRGPACARVTRRVQHPVRLHGGDPDRVRAAAVRASGVRGTGCRGAWPDAGRGIGAAPRLGPPIQIGQARRQRVVRDRAGHRVRDRRRRASRCRRLAAACRAGSPVLGRLPGLRSALPDLTRHAAPGAPAQQLGLSHRSGAYRRWPVDRRGGPAGLVRATGDTATARPARGLCPRARGAARPADRAEPRVSRHGARAWRRCRGRRRLHGRAQQGRGAAVP